MKRVKEIEIIISEIDFYLIEKVRELRLSQSPKISQVTLSQMIGVAEGFVGKVENMKEASKYNLWHINKIIKVLNLNFLDVFPANSIKGDIVRIRLKYRDSFKKDEKSYDVLYIKPLSENEMELYKQKKLSYIVEKL